MNDATAPRIPADAFDATLYRHYIESRIVDWTMTHADLLSDEPDGDPTPRTGVWRMSLSEPNLPFSPKRTLGRSVEGTIWIEDNHGTPEIVWRVGNQSNRGAYPQPPVIDWASDDPQAR